MNGAATRKAALGLFAALAAGAASAAITSMHYEELNRPLAADPGDATISGYRLLMPSWHGKDVFTFAEFKATGYNWDDEAPWKFHVSVDPNNLIAAWDLAFPILVGDQVGHFKVYRQAGGATKGVTLVEQHKKGDITKHELELGTADLLRVHNGAQITVYILEGHEEAVTKTMKKVEAALAKAKIKTGAVPASDRAIGSYVSVRYDGGPSNYKPHEGSGGYKPNDVADPFPKKF